MKILCVCGARPNFMKIAPLVSALRRAKGVATLLVHTGQHYDERMSKLFFRDLHIPEPDVNLEVGSGSQAVQTAEIMKRFEPVCLEHQPDWVVVVGDVNSTLACALVAVKLGIRVAHVEAGLRSFDRSMPEEINRVLTDAISDLLFVTEPSGVDNLRHEGIDAKKVHLVGNVMIDTLLRSREQAQRSNVLATLELQPGGYVVVTLHRPGNVDDAGVFSEILRALETISRDMTVVFPVHPRSRKNIESMGFAERLRSHPALRLIEPLGYLDFLNLMSHAAVVFTDSGGIQEETTILGVPCLTLRANTERPITLHEGTNRLVAGSCEAIALAYRDVRANPPKGRAPALWDGRAAERIAAVLTGAES
ncbi:MAG: UDP-N-acetylglucosamine 2-epimerase (non-hydrolyzing) [Planctomycetota bacterium]